MPHPLSEFAEFSLHLFLAKNHPKTSGGKKPSLSQPFRRAVVSPISIAPGLYVPSVARSLAMAWFLLAEVVTEAGVYFCSH